MVLDEVHARRRRDGAGLVRGDALLEPQRLGADRRGLASHLRGVLGRPEHVDDVDRLRDVRERPVRAFAEQLVTNGFTG